MAIDTTTGLPVIPFGPDHFWRTTSITHAPNTYYYMELRKKKKFFGLEYSVLVQKQMMLGISPHEMRKRANEVLAKIAQAAVDRDQEKTLLGDYPPKTLNK